MNYELTVDYKNNPSVFIGNPTIVCKFCSALRWKDECKTLCCSNGKVALSRVTSKFNLYIFANDPEKVDNVVYKEIF